MRQTRRGITALTLGVLGLGAVTGGLLAANASTTADSASATANIGWATQGGGTTGGSGATSALTYTVSTRAQLLKALAGTDPSTGKTSKQAKKIIKWVGSIDMTEGKAYTSHADQKSRAEVKLNSNTTIIGQGSDAALPNGWFMLRGVENVIIRNIKVVNPCDLTPKWDSKDNGGNYNSEFDGTTVDGSKRVWLDHMAYTDAPKTDDTLPLGNKNNLGVQKFIQCHDGALDIKNGSDFVTVSNTIFEKHQKLTLVGQSDNKTSDEGHQTITFAYNLYRDITARAPRVRFGKVHALNNYFVGSTTDKAYPYEYSLGTGKNSKIISTGNNFEITGVPAGSCTSVVHNPNTSNPEGNLVDSGSTVNGAALSGCTAPTAVGWTPPYSFTAMSASAAKTYVLANAGTGKI